MDFVLAVALEASVPRLSSLRSDDSGTQHDFKLLYLFPATI